MHAEQALWLPLCLVSSAQKLSHHNSFQAVIIFSVYLLLYGLHSLLLNYDDKLGGKWWFKKVKINK